MRPVLFQIFGFPVHSYGLMLAIAFLVGIVGLGKSVKKLGISFDTIVDLGTWILIGAVVGARLAYVITEYQYYLAAPLDIFKINSGGLAFHGGLIGGFLAGFWFLRRKRIYPWKLADQAAPFVALGYAVTRVGCLLNGCCYGKPTTLPWAMKCAANDQVLRHPTQIYSMIGSLVLFGILWLMRDHRRFPGFLFLLYIGLYSILRFVVEYFREGPVLVPGISLAQAVCIVLAAIAFGLIGWQEWRQQKRRSGSDAAPEIHS
jgi:phosphatidylglycerol---prolipoprotein diacylglyceryl transferase